MDDGIKEDIRAIRSDLGDIKLNVSKNTVSLQHHMSRTEANERRLEKLEYVFIGLAAVAVLGGVIKLLIS